MLIDKVNKTIGNKKNGNGKSNKPNIAKWWEQIQKWREKNSLNFVNSNESIKPQHAVQRLYELTKHKDTYITTIARSTLIILLIDDGSIWFL